MLKIQNMPTGTKVLQKVIIHYSHFCHLVLTVLSVILFIQLSCKAIISTAEIMCLNRCDMTCSFTVFHLAPLSILYLLSVQEANVKLLVPNAALATVIWHPYPTYMSRHMCIPNFNSSAGWEDPDPLCTVHISTRTEMDTFDFWSDSRFLSQTIKLQMSVNFIIGIITSEIKFNNPSPHFQTMTDIYIRFISIHCLVSNFARWNIVKDHPRHWTASHVIKTVHCLVLKIDTSWPI